MWTTDLDRAPCRTSLAALDDIADPGRELPLSTDRYRLSAHEVAVLIRPRRGV
jgi:hypothetical protein